MPRIGVGLGLGLRRASAVGGFDADAQAFFDRVTTAGGTLTTTEKNATNQLVLDMKSAGIWSAMKAVYPMVGASAAACAQNLKSSSFTGTFTSGWTFSSTGVTPNGTSAYFDTAMNPSTNLTKTSHHISFYSRTQNTSGNAWNIALGTSPDESNLSVYFAAVAQKGFLSGLYPTNWVSNTSTNTLGFHIGSETSSTSSKLYQNGSLLTTNTNSNTTAFANYNYYIGAANKGTFADNFSLHQCAFSSIGDGLTDTQASNFYTAVQTFNQTLNRQVGAQIVSDADAQAYIDRVYTAGGTLTNTEANAVNQLTIDMKAAGIWTAMKAVYPMVGSSAAACAQNLKSSSFTGTFTSGWTFASTGATPNGTSAYMNTGLKPSTDLTNNNYCLSFYSRTQDTTKQGGDIGGYNVGLSFWYSGYAKYFNTGPYPSYFTTSSNNTTTGLLLGNRQNASSAKLILNTTLLNTLTITDNSLSAYDIYLSAASNLGTAVEFQNRQCAFSSISDGLTDTQAADFYTCVQNFNTTLSRQV